jgi:hypothetical protein
MTHCYCPFSERKELHIAGSGRDKQFQLESVVSTESFSTVMKSKIFSATIIRTISLRLASSLAIETLYLSWI